MPELRGLTWLGEAFCGRFSTLATQVLWMLRITEAVALAVCQRVDSPKGLAPCIAGRQIMLSPEWRGAIPRDGVYREVGTAAGAPRTDFRRSTTKSTTPLRKPNP